MGQKGRLSDKKLARKIIESAQDIWLAGLSAFERAEQEGGKLFDSLVEEGRQVEARTRKTAGDTFDEIKSKAIGNRDSLERIFENRVLRTLTRLGIPSKAEVDALAKRIEALDANVTALAAAKQQTPSRRPSAAAAKDDLRKITGIGAVMEQRLNQQGVFTYRQIANWSDDDIQRIEKAIMNSRISGRIRRYNWVEQAKEQHFLQYNERL